MIVSHDMDELQPQYEVTMGITDAPVKRSKQKGHWGRGNMIRPMRMIIVMIVEERFARAIHRKHNTKICRNTISHAVFRG